MRLRRFREDRLWVPVALVCGAVLGMVWTSLERGGSHELDARVVRDFAVYLVGPGVLGGLYGRRLGWRVDRAALGNALLLTAFVVPFYVVGSSLPTVRAYYPMWPTTTAFSSFLPHALGQFVVILAGETFFRGLLCVGVSELGFVSVFISPVLYVFQHAAKPPIEFLLAAPTDVLFGAMDYRSDSILPSVVAHTIGVTLLDWLVLHPPLIPSATVVRWLRWLPVHL